MLRIFADRAGGLPPTGEFVQAAALPDVTQLSAAAAGGPDEALISCAAVLPRLTGILLASF